MSNTQSSNRTTQLSMPNRRRGESMKQGRTKTTLEYKIADRIVHILYNETINRSQLLHNSTITKLEKAIKIKLQTHKKEVKA